MRTKIGFTDPANVSTQEHSKFPSFYAEEDYVAIEELWLNKAQAEWLSVPAFSQIAEQLEWVGAPKELVSRTVKAKDDEIIHTILTAGIASMASGKALSINEPDQDYRLPLDGRGPSLGNDQNSRSKQSK